MTTTGYEGQHNAIRARFATAWNNKAPVAWPNVSFEPPPGLWARLTILDGDAAIASIGTPEKLTRHVGLIVIQLFVPAGEGDGAAMALGDEMAAAFRNATFGGTSNDGITCRAATVKGVGAEDTHYQVNVTIPFRRDSVL